MFLFLVSGVCFLPCLAQLWQHSEPVAVAQSNEQPLFVTKPIEQIRPGDRVLAHNPEVTDAERAVPDPDPATWRLIELVLIADDGHRIDIQLLRPLEWLEEYEAEVGETIWLDLKELGAEGEAKVLAISPCPPIQPGRGRVVTGTFRHDSGDIITVHIVGQPSIACTGNHPFWSEDRQAFVQAANLRAGERLRTVDRKLIHVKRLTCLTVNQKVYNIEVNVEHVYYVGRSGVLVHNAYTDPTTGKQYDVFGNNPKMAKGSFRRILTEKPGGKAQAQTDFDKLKGGKGTKSETTSSGTKREHTTDYPDTPGSVQYRENPNGEIRIDLVHPDGTVETIHYKSQVESGS